MKLFNSPKKGDEKSSADEAEDDFSDSPSQMVSLSPAAKGGTPARASGANQGSGAAPTASAPPIPAEEEPRTHYGIEAAIQLMRALPVDQNVELVVQVIKTTLESLKVRVSDIIQDASRKQKDIEDRVSNLRRAISDFEREIETRKEEISKLEADHLETTGVKERLELAEKAQKAAVAQSSGSSAAASLAKGKPVTAGTGA